MKTLLSIIFILFISPIVNSQTPGNVPKDLPDIPKEIKVPDRHIPKGKQKNIPGLTAAEKAAYKDKENDARNDYRLIAIFIESEYIAKALPKIEKYEKQIKSLNKKLKKDGISQKSIEKYKEEIKRITILLEIEKLWGQYKKAFVAFKQANNKKNTKVAGKAGAAIKKIKEKHKKLTQRRFPPIPDIFYSKYRDKLPELRKKHFN